MVICIFQEPMGLIALVPINSNQLLLLLCIYNRWKLISNQCLFLQGSITCRNFHLHIPRTKSALAQGSSIFIQKEKAGFVTSCKKTEKHKTGNMLRAIIRFVMMDYNPESTGWQCRHQMRPTNLTVRKKF